MLPGVTRSPFIEIGPLHHMTTTAAAVSLRGVSKRFAETAAVDDLSLDVAQGQFVTLLGPSGCGKTSTLRMIGGFEYPDRGDISLSGEVMGDRPPYRRPASLVFQQYALFPHLTIAENVGFGLRERRVSSSERRERIERVLSLVELPGFGSRRTSELSGGQQQRVALARSLVLEPTVLLLDEPLGALDLRLRRQMQIELKQIQRRVGITFLYVTHDQEEAFAMSDRMVVMNHGRLEQDGTPQEIFERPRTRFVAEFTGARNVFDGVAIAVDGGLATVVFGGLEAMVPGQGMRSGERVTIVLRPEFVRVEPRPPLERPFSDLRLATMATTWEGTIVDRMYKGATMAYTLTLPDGTAIIAEQSRERGADDLAIGDLVTAGFDPSDVVVIRERDATETREGVSL